MPIEPARRVIVVGAGTAGLCAALSAKAAGAEVVVLEAAPYELRGGNSRFSNGSFRFSHGGLKLGSPIGLERLIDLADHPHAGRLKVSAYPPENFRADIVDNSRNRSNPCELDLVVNQSFDAMLWLTEQGVTWDVNLSFAQVNDLSSDTPLEPDPGACLVSVGAGEGLTGALFSAVEGASITVRYRTALQDLITESGTVVGVRGVSDGHQVEEFGSVVLACGGFEANPEMRRKYLGTGWDLVPVRGTPFNTGRGLVSAIDIGASASGHWGGCHSVPTSADIPLIGDLIGSRSSERYCYYAGILVNANGERFIDEGEDSFLMTYTRVGQAICSQPDSVAYQVFDDRTRNNLQKQYYLGQEPLTADSLEDLADLIGAPRDQFVREVRSYNEACLPEASIAAGDFEGFGTTPGLQPPKSRWATPIDRSPFVAYKVTTGITFTYGGLVTDASMRVLHFGGHAINNLYAAGEIVGGLFFHNYPAAAGLTRGAVCGRIAGAAAAGGGDGESTRHARQPFSNHVGGHRG